MPLALLLSPDDQAVSAISAVLEEMAVTCERPLDGVSAAQKLNSHTFDLVFVDCDNLPAAKLIFDVCRRVKGSNNPVPIAIVDGRAGLPTAFRLGAELILTKPVAKDQARTTIRTAVSRVRRVDPAQVAAQSSGAERNGPPSNAVKNESPVAADSQISVEGRARGAAVGGTSLSPGMSVPAVLQMMAEPDVAPARGARESNSPASKPTKEKAVGGAKSPARTDASEEQVEKRRSRIAQVESSEQRSRREASTENRKQTVRSWRSWWSWSRLGVCMHRGCLSPDSGRSCNRWSIVCWWLPAWGSNRILWSRLQIRKSLRFNQAVHL